jgi:hypothetical protein
MRSVDWSSPNYFEVECAQPDTVSFQESTNLIPKFKVGRKGHRRHLREVVGNQIFIQKAIVSMPNDASQFDLKKALWPIPPCDVTSLNSLGYNLAKVRRIISRT